MNCLKLISLNIERDEHLNLIIPFLKKLRPDVICLQEILEPDFEILKTDLKMTGFFAPITRGFFSRRKEDMGRATIGTAIFTKLTVKHADKFCYLKFSDSVPEHRENDMTTNNWIFLYSTIIKGDQKYTIGTTYFIWTPDGKPSELQKKGLKSFLKFLEENFSEIVFCGDFNAPRGGEIFSAFASRYKDNIPLEYKTSIDPSHKSYAILRENCMVDGIFSTSGYNIKNVVLHNGLSDHCAIVADIYR